MSNSRWSTSKIGENTLKTRLKNFAVSKDFAQINNLSCIKMLQTLRKPHKWQVNIDLPFWVNVYVPWTKRKCRKDIFLTHLNCHVFVLRTKIITTTGSPSHKNGIFEKNAVLFTFSKKLTFFFMYLLRRVFSTNLSMDFKNKEKMEKLWTKMSLKMQRNCHKKIQFS